jgi:hypothetical protein
MPDITPSQLEDMLRARLTDPYGNPIDAVGPESGNPYSFVIRQPVEYVSHYPADLDAEDQDDDSECDCSECRAYRRHDDDYYSETRSHDDVVNRLLPYSYNPGWFKHGTGPCHYGAEFEISTDQVTDAVRTVRERLGSLAICKADSSVDGLEIVTHPLSASYWADSFDWTVFEALRDEASCYINPSENGIHVHVAKDGFSSPAHVLKWMKLIYRNEGQVCRLARRQSGHWAPFSDTHRKGQFGHVYKKKHSVPPMFWHYRAEDDSYVLVNASQPDYRLAERREAAGLRNSTWRATGYVYVRALNAYCPIERVIFCSSHDLADRRELFNIDTSRGYPQYSANTSPADALYAYRRSDPCNATRYAAINTTNEHTYEVRLFASTLKPAEAQSAIQLCDASVEYTRQLTAHDVAACHGWDWEAFKEYVQDGTRQYPALAAAMDCQVSWRNGSFVNFNPEV